MNSGELMFFNDMPDMLPVYQALRDKILCAYPDSGVGVTKTQIAFKNRYTFAIASLPARRRKGWPEKYLLVTFGLGCKSESPRVALAVEAYPGRWTHHVITQRPEDIDEELMALVSESYEFSMSKGKRPAKS